MPHISAKAIGRCNWFPRPDPNSIGRVENNDAIATMIIGFSLLTPPVYIACPYQGILLY
jgi:hypothetical protein